MKLALAMIVKGTDAEALILRRCLANMSPYVDGIFITRTHRPGEKPNAMVAKVATAFKAHLSDFEWVDDFSAARNFNFSQVPKEYTHIMWSDADDMWRGLEKLRPTMEKHPTTDGFGMWYLYDWDEFKRPIVVHRKTMIIKNDGCATWVGAIHEDLEGLRKLDVIMIEGIERLHITSKERTDESAKRNVRISQKEAELKPDDPRSYWNLANSQFGAAEYESATKNFELFLSMSHSDEEKYVAYCRLADIQKSLGNQEEAIQNLRIAIGMESTIPDAYLQLAHLYYTYHNYEKAEEYMIQGMLKRPRLNKMVVYNPRDYDYNPMMLLAQIYYQINRPDLMVPMLEACLKIYPKDGQLKKLVHEGKIAKRKLGKALEKVQELQKIKSKKKLKEAMDKLPLDIRSHPSIVVLRNQYFVKTESSGRDLVIYCGNTAHQWNPELFKTKGFGGSEEAVIHLAEEYAKLGWNVTVYNNCGHKTLKSEGVTYTPFWEWNYRDKQDVTILWRQPKPVDAGINSTKIFIDMHDVVPHGEFTEARLQKIDKIFVKSQFHRSLFPNVPDEKIEVVPNGFQTYPSIEKKDPYLIINTSSPDRCMDVLPKLFKEVKKRVPRARLQWAYGWDNFKTFYNNDQKKTQWMRDTQKEMDEAGIESLGRLPQHEVGKLYERASYFAYPTEFAEIDCISVKKAQAAYCLPVTTNFGALAETNALGVHVFSPKTKDNWNKPYQFHFGLEDEKQQQEWVDMMVECLEVNAKLDREEVDTWAAQFTWPEIAKRWNKHFL